MSITIGNNTLFYKINGEKYITTFISEYNPEVDTYIEEIFDGIFPLYNTNKLAYSNVCGANAEFICNNLKLNGIILGKIIITDWIKQNIDNLKTIESIYGPIGITIGGSYHALVYLEIIIENIKYYAAIETTICTPYKLQFFLGTSKEELENIINTRYQCSGFKVSFDCNKKWFDIAYSKGGTNKKYKIKNRKTKSKKIKNKKTKKQKIIIKSKSKKNK